MSGAQSRVTLFQNRWLERLTVVSAPVFVAIWGIALPLIAWLAWRNAPTVSAIGLTLAGWAIWTATEYCLHRFLFHWEPDSSRLAQFVYLMHGNHHEAPNDSLRNLMPPMVSLSVGMIVGAGLVAAFGPAGLWIWFGFMAGYVAYDLVHYACHQRPMKGRFGRMLKQHHMRHHHAHQDGNYAITGMVWDRLLGTRILSLKR